MVDRIDYSEEGRKLIARLAVGGIGRYDDKNLIWKDDRTGGRIYVGNQQAARNAGSDSDITHVINCTDDLPNFCEARALAAGTPLTYLRFHVAAWQSAGEDRRPHPASREEVWAFAQSLFTFVDAALQQGGGVLVHCLAGAHRAGTTGVLCLMHYEGLDSATATQTAKALRPAINPIGGLPGFLAFYEYMRQQQRATAPPAMP